MFRFMPSALPGHPLRYAAGTAEIQAQVKTLIVNLSQTGAFAHLLCVLVGFARGLQAFLAVGSDD